MTVKLLLCAISGISREAVASFSHSSMFVLYRYKLNDTRPGVVGVYPKLRYFRDSNKVAENGMQLE
jgi:hypothetical protein